MKIVSRQVAKQYTRDLKMNTVVFLRDVGFFGNKKKQVMELEVLPWLFEQVETFAAGDSKALTFPD